MGRNLKIHETTIVQHDQAIIESNEIEDDEFGIKNISNPQSSNEETDSFD
jgi:hypothetical protein